MAVTPHKLVHWELDPSMSEFGTPLSEASSDSMASTSSLQYINSQLIAHGFTNSPGLTVDGLSNSDSERMAKCLLAMLSQRVGDMSRAEDISTKLRTLSYDHERLTNMHRSATDRAANVEREMNVYKSRLATTTRSLQSAETAHKHTTCELQRTRTSLQALRATYQSEIKKKEKDVEKITERWTKLADLQTKLSTSSSGMFIRGANADIVTSSETLGKGRGYLEIALEQAEAARSQLGNETISLRQNVLKAVNGIQSLLYHTRALMSNEEEEPTPLTSTVLFPLCDDNVANEKLDTLFASIHGTLNRLSQHLAERATAAQTMTSVTAKATDDPERERLQSVINTLRVELEDAKKLHANHTADTQILFQHLTDQPAPIMRDVADVSVDLMTAPERDEERTKLENLKQQLDEERKKFTEAALKLGKERAALESERVKFVDEKRSWQVEQMLADLPPTPEAADSAMYKSMLANNTNLQKSPRKSPRKSPSKPKVVGKSGSGRKTRVSRRSSILALPTASKIEPAYETEVVPIPAPAFEIPINKPASSLAQSILPTSFVLPPPSPQTSLPPPQSLLPTSVIPAAFEISNPDKNSSSSDESADAGGNSVAANFAAQPKTPPALNRRPFPIAKPLAARMTHAYSPVKPSPLSRILMLANSPDSPEFEPLQPLSEESESFTESSLIPGPQAKLPEMDFASEDSPLREKKTEPNVVATARHPAKSHTSQAEVKRFTSREKGKGQAGPGAGLAVTSRTKTLNAGEKENRDKANAKMARKPVTNAAPPVAAQSKPKSNGPGDARGPKPNGSSLKTAMKLPPGKGGARRVPIESAEAAPLPGWKG
ncbi:Afadin and alpha-actinin-binding-domain-containing protein [Hygrophoropsis aurantiaca]|uniref:Afadin and alpha-actinin-binding-domain-containing protein n=1 Tax=Hygrophoropsis aurantiaca TaxID=72124 RepID=A0ACB8APU9_9AGAM|nr:Afadin and alpha-actinin-binding-domain-containing protein [Hygrophoropsis aurantiaca]